MTGKTPSTARKPPNRLRARTSVTLDPDTIGRLATIVDRVAGVKSLSAAIDYAAQYTADRLPRKRADS